MAEIRYSKFDRDLNEKEINEDLFYWIWERLDQGMIEEKIKKLSKMVAFLLAKEIEKDEDFLQRIIGDLGKHDEGNFSVVKGEDSY